MGVIACPRCRRRVFSRRDMLYVPLDGCTRCRFCGQPARLDLLSRWMLSIVIAIILPAVLFTAGVFYSGHLFVVSIVVVLGAWRLLCYLGAPFLTLEPTAETVSIGRKGSMLILGSMLAAAIVLDGFMASRFGADDGVEDTRAVSPVAKSGTDTNFRK